MAGTAWDSTKLHVFHSRALEEQHPAAAAMLGNVELNTERVNGIVYALSVDGRDPDEFARDWVAENSDLVDSWFN